MKTTSKFAKALKNNTIFVVVPCVALGVLSILGANADDTVSPKTTPSLVFGGSQQQKVGFGSYLSGRFARMNGDVSGALRYLQNVYQQQPDNLVVASQLRDAYLQEGDVEGAMKVAQTMHKNSQQEVFANLMLALQAVQQQDFAAARDFLDNISQEAEGQLWLPLVSGWVDVGAKTLKHPILLDELAVDVGRVESVVNYHIGLINAAGGFIEEAAKNFAHAVENPASPPERVMAVILRFDTQHNSPKVLQPLIQSYKRTHPDIQADEVVVVDTPAEGVAEVLFTMSSVMMAGEMAYDAVIYLQLALYARPDFPVATLLLGEAYAQLGEYDRSSQQYAKITPSNPFYIKTQQRMASNLDKLDKTAQALALLDKVARENPSMPDALMAKGDMLRQRQRFEEAANVYSQALERAGANEFSRWSLYFARGVCYERIGRWKEAEQDLEMALQVNPHQPDVLNYLAYGWLERGERISQARVMLDKALRARPDDPQILDSMGWALYMSGNYIEAVEYIERALEMLPSDAEVNEHLGDVYWRVGRRTEARFQWDRALTFSPDTKRSQRLELKMKEGLPAVKMAETVEKKPL